MYPTIYSGLLHALEFKIFIVKHPIYFLLGGLLTKKDRLQIFLFIVTVNGNFTYRPLRGYYYIRVCIEL